MVINSYDIEDKRKLHALKIAKNICDYFQMDISDILTPLKGTDDVTYVRNWCMWFCLKETKLTLVETGKLFGGRHYSTVIHGRNDINEYVFNRVEDNHYKEDFVDLYQKKIAYNGVEELKRPKRKNTTMRINRVKKVGEEKEPIPLQRPKAIYSNTDFSKKYL